MSDTTVLAPVNGAIATTQPSHAGLAMSFQDMRMRVKLLDDFYKDVMQEGTDYGVIPGTPKPSLYQPGAQLLDAIFGAAPKFEELEGTIRDYDKGFFAYEIRCTLVNKQTGEVLADAIGSCNSMEGRYRWRDAKRTCPQCGGEFIIKGKQEYGGGWLCFKKNGGCGAKYRDGDQSIEGQAAGKVENDDPYTLANTILKMAQKRAHVAATLNATGASRIFTQDVEDMGDLIGSSPRQAPVQERREDGPLPSPDSEAVRWAHGDDPEKKPAQRLTKRQQALLDGWTTLQAQGREVEIEIPDLDFNKSEATMRQEYEQWLNHINEVIAMHGAVGDETEIEPETLFADEGR